MSCKARVSNFQPNSEERAKCWQLRVYISSFIMHNHKGHAIKIEETLHGAISRKPAHKQLACQQSRFG
jgi:hypothetical protein